MANNGHPKVHPCSRIQATFARHPLTYGSPCSAVTTRQMTDEERTKYGAALPVPPKIAMAREQIAKRNRTNDALNGYGLEAATRPDKALETLLPGPKDNGKTKKQQGGKPVKTQAKQNATPATPAAKTRSATASTKIDRRLLLDMMVKYGWTKDALITISERMTWNLQAIQITIVDFELVSKAETRLAYELSKETIPIESADQPAVPAVEKVTQQLDEPVPSSNPVLVICSDPIYEHHDEPASRVSYILDEMCDTYLKKNHDYGDSFSKSVASFGIVAAAVRLSDKWNRAENLMKGAAQMVADEKLRDTLLDMANYCVMTVYELDRISEANLGEC